MDSLAIAAHLDDANVLSPAALELGGGVLGVFSFGTSANPGAGAGAFGDGNGLAPRLLFGAG